MEPYTDMKYSDCGCSGRCRKVSGNQNQSVRSCLDPAMQAGNVTRYPQMGNPMNDGMMPENRMTGQTPRMMPENGMAGQMPQIMPANNGTGRLPANDATMQVPQNGNNWENNRDFGWNYMPGLEGNAGSFRKRLSAGNGLCAMAAVEEPLWSGAGISPGNHLFRTGPGF